MRKWISAFSESGAVNTGTAFSLVFVLLSAFGNMRLQKGNTGVIKQC